MIGKHRIIVQNKRVRYDFEIRRNITIVRGDSATGKTALVEMIREYYELGFDSGIDLQCDKSCVVISGVNWSVQLSLISDSIVFIDEGNSFVLSKEFAKLVQDSDNYYVLVTRESVPVLPYSVEEVYGIRTSGKYASLKQTYNEFYHLYGKDTWKESVKPQIVITEDSNAGNQFFNDMCIKNGIECKSAHGKSNIFSQLIKQKNEETLVIADGAAFGSEMDKILKLLRSRENIKLFLPESFEWLILQSGIVNDKDLESILEATYNYVESKEYLSWERYFTHLLTEKTADSYLKYNKNFLNDAYLQENVQRKIADYIKYVDFAWKSKEICKDADEEI